MADSIREQLFDALALRLAQIRTSNQFQTDIGAHVVRSHLPAVGSEVVPVCGFSIGIEENSALYNAKEDLTLPITVQGVAAFGSSLPPEICEKIYADIHEGILSPEWTVNFNSGGTSEIVAGNKVTGAGSSAEGVVISISVTSGTWGSGNAAGNMKLRRVTGTFQAGENLNVGITSNLATVNGSPSGQSSEQITTGGLCDRIALQLGEILLPEADGLHSGARATFLFNFKRIRGNPYSQTN